MAADDGRRLLAEELAEGFEVQRVIGVRGALELLAHRDFDALLLHLDLGVAGAIELLGELKRRRVSGRVPGVVAVARELDIRSVVAVMRAGAFDVVLEAPMKPHELAHLVRNAAFCSQSTARLGERRAPQSQEVLVVGTGDGVEAIVLLLESSGVSVRHLGRMPRAGEISQSPRAIVVDLTAIGTGEDLLRLLAPRTSTSM